MSLADYQGEHEAIKQAWRAQFASLCQSFKVKDVFTLANPEDNRDVTYFESQGLPTDGWTIENGDIRTFHTIKPEGLFLDAFGRADGFEEFLNRQLMNNPNLKVIYINFSVRGSQSFDTLTGFKRLSHGTYGFQGPMDSGLFYRASDGAKQTIRKGKFLDRFKDAFNTEVVSTKQIASTLGKSAVQQVYKYNRTDHIRRIAEGGARKSAMWQLNI